MRLISSSVAPDCLGRADGVLELVGVADVDEALSEARVFDAGAIEEAEQRDPQPPCPAAEARDGWTRST